MPYIVPGENGNRAETRWLALVDAEGTGLGVLPHCREQASTPHHRYFTVGFPSHHRGLAIGVDFGLMLTPRTPSPGR